MMTTLSPAIRVPKLRKMNNRALLSYQDVYLRALEPEDLDLLYLIENDGDIWQHGVNKAPLSRFCLKQYLENSLSQTLFESGELRLVAVHTASHEALGFIDLFDYDQYHARASVGVVIKKQAQGKTFAFQALEALKIYAKAALHLHQLSAQMAVDNLASVRLFEKAGFRQCGCLKDWMCCGEAQYQDVAMMQILLS